ncbi:succinate dehydrogenase, hydrophobic membrane anchor protein [Rehaibacterium terrae]|jgi:succinate dehydrogenase / fumarate reductase membrane anchor subunit|uniref:Succinate dehydrogenase hydrophobic membrane anchor subunit n=1 Tax=Rehaibacterium terrae TaxID=1341696 RepID=A0A7W8DF64_9GAMM|nr:succinate dehydrogenase, hydrophobic membrane anchor protein [Rehaibacterium terrae]MBB5016217.1 succinate dehydrogenase / fumarate reductase membrane anchor subunit [Rehaibacterium terrae]
MSHLRNPLAVARGLGAAKDGVHHWWLQRVTAVALALLSPWFVYTLVSLVGADYQTVRLTLAQPVTASLLAIYVGALFWHAQLGLQVVIEDYVHTRWLEIALQLVVRFACLFAAVLAFIAIGRIVFTA